MGQTAWHSGLICCRLRWDWNFHAGVIRSSIGVAKTLRNASRIQESRQFEIDIVCNRKLCSDLTPSLNMLEYAVKFHTLVE